MKLKLKTKTFLTVSVDNIDFNIQSSVSTISLHGTVAVSINTEQGIMKDSLENSSI